MTNSHLIIGSRGQVGAAICALLRTHEELVYEIDVNIDHADPSFTYDFIHVCIPDSKTFLANVSHYIGLYQSQKTITIIHSTVKPFTTNQLMQQFPRVVYSPVRGMHPQLLDGLLTYEKFFTGPTPTVIDTVSELFRDLELIPRGKCEMHRSLEFAKPLCTTYYFLIIAFWQEVVRLCQKYDLSFTTIKEFIETTNDQLDDRPILPYVQAVGKKEGDHCLEPNARMLTPFSILPQMILQINELFRNQFGDKRIEVK